MDAEQDRVEFSIVVPAYNEARYLAASLRSLQTQDFTGRYEIIVVDNNSTDETAEVAAACGVEVVSETTQGVCAARQRGAEVSRGDVIISTDADTLYPSDWLRRVSDGFAGDPRTVAVAGPCRYETSTWWPRAYTTVLFGLVHRISALTGVVLYVSATNLAFRRSAFPGYNLHLTQGGDELDLLRRLRHRGRVVWDHRNVVGTSARRFRHGLLYSVVVCGLIYYILGYVVNRISARRTIGMAPAFRQAPEDEGKRPRRRLRRAVWASIGVALVGLGMAFGVGSFAFAALVRFWAAP